MAGLALWMLVPLVVFASGSGVFNGSYDADVPDRMQYLGFIRDSGEHLLISNRFDIVPDPHVFLDPVFALSGLVWRLGASIQLADLLWVPVAAVVLCVGFVAYARRLLAPDRVAIAIALVLAFFYVTPAMPLADWLHGSAELKFGTQVVGQEVFAAGYAWSGGPAEIAVGLMPLFLLGIERVLEPSRRAEGRSARWYAIWAGLAGMLASWLHPWQGITLLAIVAGLVVWARFDRRYLVLALPVGLTVAPIGYFFALSHTHSSWMTVSRPNGFSHVGLWLWLGLAPIVLALPGFRGRDVDLQERMLRIWPFAALTVYFALHRTWFYHAFAGLSLPLAILAVKGWRDLRVARFLTAGLVVAVTLPGTVWVAQYLIEHRASNFFTPGESRALAFLNHSPRPGPVLAPVMPLGQAVPAFTGRQTYAGHYYWTWDYFHRAALTEQLFDGRLPPGQALQLVRVSKAAFLASDCARRRANLQPILGDVITRVRRFGCATVYEVRPPALAARLLDSPART